MGEALFVEVFGDVFEHTPEITRAAYRKGLGLEADTAEGLHEALVATLHGMNAVQKKSLLDAHPDLAGRLALARSLTADSTGEQAGAGLDRLLPEELARFTELNGAYRDRFGFPFIMAVKGCTKGEILDAFVTRLSKGAEEEFELALAEVALIALLRLQDRLPKRS
ncbi:MAG: 2-oxo-4-hydroxy-4-carboxy-5-ureidoimidazoline decarboxylase [Janthinobacterium lividum]